MDPGVGMDPGVINNARPLNLTRQVVRVVETLVIDSDSGAEDQAPAQDLAGPACRREGLHEPGARPGGRAGGALQLPRHRPEGPRDGGAAAGAGLARPPRATAPSFGPVGGMQQGEGRQEGWRWARPTCQLVLAPGPPAATAAAVAAAPAPNPAAAPATATASGVSGQATGPAGSSPPALLLRWRCGKLFLPPAALELLAPGTLGQAGRQQRASGALPVVLFAAPAQAGVGAGAGGSSPGAPQICRHEGLRLCGGPLSGWWLEGAAGLVAAVLGEEGAEEGSLHLSRLTDGSLGVKAAGAVRPQQQQQDEQELHTERHEQQQKKKPANDSNAGSCMQQGGEGGWMGGASGGGRGGDHTNGPFTLRWNSRSYLTGTQALHAAYPQQVEAVRWSGTSQRVRLYGRAAGGQLLPYEMTLGCNRSSYVLYLCGLSRLVGDLGLRPGGSLRLFVGPSGRVVVEVEAGSSDGVAAAVQDPNTVQLTESYLRSCQVCVPLRIVARLLGGDVAAQGSEGVPVRLEAEGAGAVHPATARLRSYPTPGTALPKWTLSGFTAWLRACGAAAGDKLRLGTALVASAAGVLAATSGAGAAPATVLTVCLVKALADGHGPVDATSAGPLPLAAAAAAAAGAVPAVQQAARGTAAWRRQPRGAAPAAEPSSDTAASSSDDDQEDGEGGAVSSDEPNTSGISTDSEDSDARGAHTAKPAAPSSFSLLLRLHRSQLSAPAAALRAVLPGLVAAAERCGAQPLTLHTRPPGGGGPLAVHCRKLRLAVSGASCCIRGGGVAGVVEALGLAAGGDGAVRLRRLADGRALVEEAEVGEEGAAAGADAAPDLLAAAQLHESPAWGSSGSGVPARNRAADANAAEQHSGGGLPLGAGRGAASSTVGPFELKLTARGSALHGTQALLVAYPQQVEAVRRSGTSQRVRLYGRAAGGQLWPYEVTLCWSRGARQLYVCGMRWLVDDLGLRPGGRLRLFVEPPGRAVVEVAAGSGCGEGHDPNTVQLTEVYMRSQRVYVPHRIMARLLGSDVAASGSGSESVPVQVEGEQGQAAPAADARLSSKANEGKKLPEWYLRGIAAWLRASGAVAGDKLRLAASGAAAAPSTTITVSLLKAGREGAGAGPPSATAAAAAAAATAAAAALAVGAPGPASDPGSNATVHRGGSDVDQGVAASGGESSDEPDSSSAEDDGEGDDEQEAGKEDADASGRGQQVAARLDGSLASGGGSGGTLAAAAAASERQQPDPAAAVHRDTEDGSASAAATSTRNAAAAAAPALLRQTVRPRAKLNAEASLQARPTKRAKAQSQQRHDQEEVEEGASPTGAGSSGGAGGSSEHRGSAAAGRGGGNKQQHPGVPPASTVPPGAAAGPVAAQRAAGKVTVAAAAVACTRQASLAPASQPSGAAQHEHTDPQPHLLAALPAASISHLHGCLPPGAPQPPKQPGEVRVWGVTFHPDLAQRVRSAAARWRQAAAARHGLPLLAAAAPAELQISIPGVDEGGAAAGTSASAALPKSSWQRLFRRRGLDSGVVRWRLARLLGLVAAPAAGGLGLDAPLPEASPPLLAGVEARRDAGRGGAGLFATVALRASEVVGVVGGYVLSHGCGRVHVAGGYVHLQPAAQEALRRRAAAAVEGPGAGAAGAAGAGTGSELDDALAWSFLAGSFRLPYEGGRELGTAVEGEEEGGVGPSPLELHTLGYGNATALVSDPRADLWRLQQQPPHASKKNKEERHRANKAERKALRRAANCMVLPVLVRGVPLPVLVALRDIAPGEQLLRDYGADWWVGPLAAVWRVLRFLGADAAALLHEPQRLAEYPQHPPPTADSEEAAAVPVPAPAPLTGTSLGPAAAPNPAAAVPPSAPAAVAAAEETEVALALAVPSITAPIAVAAALASGTCGTVAGAGLFAPTSGPAAAPGPELDSALAAPTADGAQGAGRGGAGNAARGKRRRRQKRGGGGGAEEGGRSHRRKELREEEKEKRKERKHEEGERPHRVKDGKRQDRSKEGEGEVRKHREIKGKEKDQVRRKMGDGEDGSHRHKRRRDERGVGGGGGDGNGGQGV